MKFELELELNVGLRTAAGGTRRPEPMLSTCGPANLLVGQAFALSQDRLGVEFT